MVEYLPSKSNSLCSNWYLKNICIHCLKLCRIKAGEFPGGHGETEMLVFLKGKEFCAEFFVMLFKYKE
jgi:hypothetical protein